MEPDDPQHFIGTPLMVPTEQNGSIHWEARLLVMSLVPDMTDFKWRHIEVELLWNDGTSSEVWTALQPDTGRLTDVPEVFYVERLGLDETASKGDIIRVTGLSHGDFPLRVRVFWDDDFVTRVDIEDLPRAYIELGEESSTLVTGDGHDDYRTYLLPVTDLYAWGQEVRWSELRVDVPREGGNSIYHNDSLSMRIDEGRPLPTIIPQEVMREIPVAFVINGTDPDQVSPGDALYFPGIWDNMWDFFVEVRWHQDLVGRLYISNYIRRR